VAGLEVRAATLEREQEHLTAIAVAHERAAIAREMHDVVAHSLAVIIVQSDGGRYAMANDPDTGRAVLETVAGTARDALEEMGRLIDLLRGSDDGDLDGDRRVWGLDSMSALVDRARAAGLDVTARIDPVPLAPNSTVGVAAYRLVQEALTNTLRHAGPGTISTISVSGDGDTLVIAAIDDGAGHTTSAAPGRVGHGLVGMRERVALFNGRLAAGPRPGGGWSMRAELPIPAWERVPGDLTVAS
jgi:signal transduction histidine kinase